MYHHQPHPELPIDPPSGYYDLDALDDEQRQEQRETDGDADYHYSRELED